MRYVPFLLCLSHLCALPLHFEPNIGQVKGRTEWMARAPGAWVYIAGSEIAFVRHDSRVHMTFVGASRAMKSTGLELLGAYSNYFVGPKETDWFVGVPHYASLRYTNLYPGIDVVYYESNGNLEYDFVVRPGADPNQIELAFDQDVQLDDRGALVVGSVRQHRPRVIQGRREISSEYELTRENHVRIKLGRYGLRGALAIDPVLEFSTYLGGPGNDSVTVVKLDASGNILLGGYGETQATPTLDPFQQTNTIVSGAWLMKLAPDGKRVIFYTLLSHGAVSGLELDPDGNLLITGSASAGAIPVKNAFEPSCTQACGFIAKLSADGRTVLFSSYVRSGSLALDPQGNAFVVSGTTVLDLPTKNAIQKQLRGSSNCFVSKISSAGALVFATYLGSSGLDSCQSAAVGRDGALIFTGHTSAIDFPLKDPVQQASNPGPFGAPFLVKMASDGQSLILSTYIGGEIFSGWGTQVAVDFEGHIYLIGRAFNAFFTLKNAYQTVWMNDSYGFLMKMDGSGKNIIYSTFFGSWFQNLAVDKDENVYAITLATSPDVPLKDSFQEFLGGGVANSDVLIAKFASSGNSLIYSTLLGGTNEDWGTAFTLDSQGTVYVGGFTLSTDFPVKNAYQPTYGGGAADGFLAKISDLTTSLLSPLLLTPAQVAFQFVQSGPPPAPQSVAVTGTEGYFLTTSPTWISATPSGPGPPNKVQISVSPVGLAPGAYTGAVTLHPTSGDPMATIDVSVIIYAPAPVLTNVDPALVSIGSDDTLITITGSGFVSGSTVLVGNVLWTTTPVTIVNSTTIAFKIPKLYFTGLTNYPITVQNPKSLASNSIAVSVGNPAPTIATGGILNAASYARPPVSVGEMVVIFGSNFGSIDTTKVLFQNVPGTVIYVTPTQLAATIPAGAGGVPSIAIQVQTSHDVYSAPVTVAMAPSSPALFTSDATGQGQAAAINQDNSVNSASNPAPAGSVVALYATGGGALTADALPRLALPVAATVGGLYAQVLYAGVAPGEPDGTIQINVQVPAGLTSGAAEVVVTIGDAGSQRGAMLAVR
jgi:uncharacterized protein (TIGR03437 family)